MIAEIITPIITLHYNNGSTKINQTNKLKYFTNLTRKKGRNNNQYPVLTFQSMAAQTDQFFRYTFCKCLQQYIV